MKKPAEDVRELMHYLTPDEQHEVMSLVDADLAEKRWRPLVGPQAMAYVSKADVIGFGGAAGGGKTDLACGMSLTNHFRTAIFRRVGTELTAVVDRLEELIDTRDGYNGKDKIWRLPNEQRQIELCSVPNAGDEKNFQGRPKDLLVLDEAANLLESQARFLMGWVRSVMPGVHSQTLMTFNPPTSSEGRWIVAFFAPWIDKRFPGKRAQAGELRWAVMVPNSVNVSRDVWFDNYPGQCVIKDDAPCFDFDANDYEPEDIITPQSRTFIPSRISDNPHLIGTGYLSVLQAMPEPARSQMLYGDFEAGMQDSIWQVIPTQWVEDAMMRWNQRSPKGEMDSMGVDVARGGSNATVLSARHGNWYDKLKGIPGKDTPDGNYIVGQVVAMLRDHAPVHVDVIGVGASPYDLLKNARYQAVGVNVGERSNWTGKSGRLQFANLRSELWWRMREDLDPANDKGIMLPPDQQLMADLCAPEWKMAGRTIEVEDREAIIKRIGRSPDSASAVILAQLTTPKREAIRKIFNEDNKAVLAYDPFKPPERTPVNLDFNPYMSV